MEGGGEDRALLGKMFQSNISGGERMMEILRNVTYAYKF